MTGAGAAALPVPPPPPQTRGCTSLARDLASRSESPGSESGSSPGSALTCLAQPPLQLPWEEPQYRDLPQEAAGDRLPLFCPGTATAMVTPRVGSRGQQRPGEHPRRRQAEGTGTDWRLRSRRERPSLQGTRGGPRLQPYALSHSRQHLVSVELSTGDPTVAPAEPLWVGRGLLLPGKAEVRMLGFLKLSGQPPDPHTALLMCTGSRCEGSAGGLLGARAPDDPFLLIHHSPGPQGTAQPGRREPGLPSGVACWRQPRDPNFILSGPLSQQRLLQGGDPQPLPTPPRPPA